MTAVNRAVNSVNRAAHRLKDHGFRGNVILFDEAERSEWAESIYREERAYDLMMGFGRASANKRTSHLKHYWNRSYPSYITERPSLIHSVFFFSWEWSLARRISQDVGRQFLRLPALSTSDRENLIDGIGRVFSAGYRSSGKLTNKTISQIRESYDGEDVRSLVRASVSALDYQRWRRMRLNGK